MKFPQKLKLIRSSKNWTQKDMAEKLDISTHAYAKIERGETMELWELFASDEKMSLI